MSVPPLVCSTPPPPDHVEEGYNDEFTFTYDDLSTSHQFETREYSLYDEGPSPRDKPEDKICISPSNITFHQADTIDTLTKSNEPVLSIPSDSFPNDRPPEEIPNNRTVEEIPNEMDSPGFSEDCNVEDLDLKLDSLHIDFENDRVTVEDSLNSTFDDFGTFLSNTDFVQKMDNIFCESDKDSKSHGTCSEESTSLHNEDWDNISQNSFNTNSNTIPDQDDINYIKKDNNDNISKDVITLNSPSDIIPTSTNKEESIDSGFKSSINISNDQIHGIKQDQLDSKSDLDVSVSDANTLSFSEYNELDKSKVENCCEEETSVDVVNKKDTQIDNESDGLENNFATFATEENIDFKADFNNENDDFGSFAEAKPESSSFIDAKTNLDLNFSDETYEPINDEEFGTFTDFESKDLKTDSVDKTIILKDTRISDEDEFDDFNEFQKETFTETNKTTDFEFVDSQNDANLESKSIKEDDDFGDFDTYDPKTMVHQVKENETTISKSCTLNDLVSTNETDIMEILKNAVSTIYHEDGVTDNVDDEYELMSSLGSSWKHLTEYETKQSYLFSWNNSSSQKTLLKSLGIDSRNILFGPKWNSSMPRFAANLGASPLQPIKQAFTQLSSDIQHEDKSSLNAEMDDNSSYSQPKVADWQGDNFTMGDNQASSYAESLLLDLEHLMATLDQMTSGQSPHFKISDLFTNACTEREEEHVDKSYAAPGELGSKPEKHQPPSILNIGRKINLPDTHIFTPTDSETPWSHTIHYEDASNNFIPNLPCNSDETFPTVNAEVIPTSHIKTEDDFDDFQSHSTGHFADQEINREQLKDLQQIPVEVNEDKTTLNEFDDFGDFHSATTIEAIVHKPEIIQPTNLLQPTIMIPSVSVPVVNWPEPGDVDTSVFEQLSDLPSMQSTLPSWVENKEQPSWMIENKEKFVKFEPKDLHIPAFVPPKVYPSVPTSFILKETKIDSVASATPVNNIKSTINSDVDDFTDFQSVTALPSSTHNKHPYGNSTNVTAYNTNNAAGQFASSDFDDFQSAQYNPSQHNQINTTSFISSPQMPNYFLPSTLGESFLKSDNFKSAPFQRFEEPIKNTTQQQQQILHPLSLENHSRINWPNPGIDMQDLSRFNPVNSIHSYSEPKETKVNNHHSNDDDGWSDFVSIKTVNQPSKYFQQPNHNSQSNEEDDWSDFVSGTVVPSRSVNEVKTISQNIQSQTNSANIMRNSQPSAMNSQYSNVAPNLTALPHLSYASTKINSKSNFQNL